MHTFKDITIDQLDYVFKQIIDIAGGCKVFFIDAPMGAGKTTFINAACGVLGVTSPTSSPTYAIINEYATDSNATVYHIDCYRLKSVQEALDAGVGECIDSGNYCFIEWADMIKPLWPERYVHIRLEAAGDVRTISMEAV